MLDNPYAPPTAEVRTNEQAPPLWNPNAALFWSLLFTPAFGAFLHMKNWQALGEPKKAAASKYWVIAIIVLQLAATGLSVFIPEMDRLPRPLALGLFVAWCLAGARGQVALVKTRFGADYPRRGWGKPLLIGGGLLVAWIALIIAAELLANSLSARPL